MSTVSAAAGGHVGVCGSCCYRGSCWCLVCAGSGDHVDINDHSSHRRSCWCMWSQILPETVLMSVIDATSGAMLRSVSCVAARGYVNVCSPSCCQRPWWSPWSVILLRVCVDGWDLCSHGKACRSPWSMLLLVVMGKRASVTVISMTSGLYLRMQDTDGFSNNLSCTNNNNNNSKIIVIVIKTI